MLSFVFTILMFIVFGKLLIFAIKAAWSISKIICSLVLLPLLLVGLVLKGLIVVALLVLIVVGFVVLFKVMD